MQLYPPELLTEVCGLTLPLSITGVVIGAALWLFGWWSHRFWMVLLTTVIAGTVVLHEAPALRAQPLATALVLALAAGVLAVELVRVLAFVSGGACVLALVQQYAPAWEHGVLCFLGGGLLALLLFRLWLMFLTCSGGTLLLGYSILALVQRRTETDMVRWSQEHPRLLLWVSVLVMLLGVVIQLALSRKKAAKPAASEEKQEKPKPSKEPPKPKPWLWIPFRNAA